MRRGTPQGWLRRAFCAAVILLLCGSCGQCCGPGRGGGRRRSPRRLTPLVFKQHVPNVAENTLGASGLTEGKITRGDPRFSDLVPNYNKDILFSDEEGTGADRLMTERCKEKLNSLAISVMNQWPGVRLRVTEAWDEGSLHAPNSLHYEGRAVDITTSDKDYSKHGMLARLAVQAGFDWVYYETRSRVHCSVKSESNSMRKLGGCFPGEAQVETPQGRVPVRDLQQGTPVKVLQSDGSLAFSPVLMFLHKDESYVRSFLTISSENSDSITLTPSHLILVLRREKAPLVSPPTVEDAMRSGEAILAGQVNPGDFLLVAEHRDVALRRVVDIEATTLEGVFAPLTKEGTIIIDDVVASCYAVIDSQGIAHGAFLPVRFYYKLKDIILNLFYFGGGDASPPHIGKGGDKKCILGSSEKCNSVNDDLYNLVIDNNNSVNVINNSINDIDNSVDVINRKRNSTKSFMPKSLSTRSHHIHWYPKLLYSIASWVLPRHLVNS